MTKIKLCGLTKKEDIIAANKCKPDYVGFVFWSKSKRSITLERAITLKALLDQSIETVGVFVNDDISFVKDLFMMGAFDIAQLHGNESEDYIKALRDEGIPVIKVFKVLGDEGKDILKKAEETDADHIMFDAGMGEGKTFDSSILKGFKRPFFLAGGLNATNVEELIKDLHPFAVDVSSGIETNGCKDKTKMLEFTSKVRNLE